MADNPLTNKYGPLQGWQWVAVIGAGLGVFLYIRNRKTASSSADQTATGIDPTTGVPYAQEYGPGGLGGNAIDAIVGQAGPPGKPGAKGARGPRGPAGPPAKKDTTRKRPSRADLVAGESFAQQVERGLVPWPAGVPVPKGTTLGPDRKVRRGGIRPTRTVGAFLGP